MFNIKLKSKVTRQVLIMTISLVAAAVTLYVAYASLVRRNISISSPDSRPGAANPSCMLTLSLKRPTPPPPTPTPPACVESPVDIVIALDRSGTMGENGVNGRLKLSWAKEAAVNFVNTIRNQPAAAQANIRIGVVDWAGNRHRVKTFALTNNWDAVISYINSVQYLGISVDGYTCIECAVRSAGTLLQGSTGRRAVILMSDGIANRITTSCANTNQSSCTNPTPPACTNDPYLAVHCPAADLAAINAANAQKAAGIDYYVVGYGINTPPVTMLEDNLKSISSGEGNYFYGGSETNWTNVFKQIAPRLCSEVSVPTPVATIKPTTTPHATVKPTPKPSSCPWWKKTTGACK